MHCPFCKHEESRVLDSRSGPDGQSIRRRRECVACNKRWKTLERVDIEMPLVKKRNNTFEPFDREKLRSAIQVSCGKRPVNIGQIDKVVAQIEWDLIQSGQEYVKTKDLGASVMEALRGIDEIAYIRYASVYKRFRDVEEMLAGMKDLLEVQENQRQTSGEA
jgi:transcriptional repressor NrdR